MKDIQKEVSKMIEKYGLESPLEERFIDLVSEVGELGKEILKGSEYGKKEFDITDNIESEIGDVLFSLMCISNALDIDMKRALDSVLKKYNDRFSKKGNIGSGR